MVTCALNAFYEKIQLKFHFENAVTGIYIFK
jgi:hypothetical protein